ncbi:enoyl-CoA hydratase/isomerase family protein [Priestia megaterium]|uniref:enoyl-CoA hydratase/isomerase family protein n=2 Tax=Priestia megaterium TaxID=1404 RepID=UPI002E24C617|nr:enoyl-CoA hydratase/isomerase family protein [Priestia megaterium]MED4265054.1 enoyl-CoA hydratase/isomerase family protein [Priestia megaterium]MED4277245.1 enoyl-CoA hydratase/isomerase family protein [Priestia megaterium]MED4283219.1 enoyl-CoA hydratase/isomerase family protein [Priestia megaterium]MED4288306.1 enoyl-CoA hydratase/isomerase family protein [Priestia megaterium]
MMKRFIKVEKRNHVAVVRMNQSMLNRLNSEVMYELQETMNELQHDGSVGSIVFMGEYYKMNGDHRTTSFLREETGRLYQPIHAVAARAIFQRISCSSKQTIALLTNFTFGGGYELALACDVRIAEEPVQLKLTNGMTVSAQEACNMGKVQHVVQKGKGLEYSLALNALEKEA